MTVGVPQEAALVARGRCEHLRQRLHQMPAKPWCSTKLARTLAARHYSCSSASALISGFSGRLARCPTAQGWSGVYRRCSSRCSSLEGAAEGRILDQGYSLEGGPGNGTSPRATRRPARRGVAILTIPASQGRRAPRAERTVSPAPRAGTERPAGRGHKPARPPPDSGLDVGPDSGGCNAATCTAGCCDINGICQPGSQTTSCGTAGQNCANCPQEGFQQCDPNLQECDTPQATCSPASCPTGCCQPDGTGGFAPTARRMHLWYRRPGVRELLVGGRHCDGSGQCIATACGPQNCSGCCLGSSCIPGDETNACGVGGAQQPELRGRDVRQRKLRNHFGARLRTARKAAAIRTGSAKTARRRRHAG